MGPYGNVEVIEDNYVALLAESEGLTLQKNMPGFGLVESMDVYELSPEEKARLRPEVVDFYENTIDYELEVWSEWCAAYRPFAGLLTHMYSKRLQQLNLPMSSLSTSGGFRARYTSCSTAPASPGTRSGIGT
jgi:hypothetical protein